MTDTYRTLTWDQFRNADSLRPHYEWSAVPSDGTELRVSLTERFGSNIYLRKNYGSLLAKNAHWHNRQLPAGHKLATSLRKPYEYVSLRRTIDLDNPDVRIG